jgi:hypothetical protein
MEGDLLRGHRASWEAWHRRPHVSCPKTSKVAAGGRTGAETAVGHPCDGGDDDSGWWWWCGGGDV